MGVVYKAEDPGLGRFAALLLREERLVLFDFATRTWRELTRLTRLGYPNCFRDGQHIYFKRGDRSGAAMYRLRVSDGKLEQVVSLGELNPKPSASGPVQPSTIPRSSSAKQACKKSVPSIGKHPRPAHLDP